MQRLGWLVMVAACGGKAPTTTTTPTATTPTSAPSNETGATTAAPPAPPAGDTNVCDQRADRFGPYTLDATQAAARYGLGATKITDAPSTKEKAIEVCGIPASTAWLGSVTCAGGEKPKQLGRRGSVGAGGRCESIIDKYGVECPEQTYEVFIDIYMCGPGESLM